MERRVPDISDSEERKAVSQYLYLNSALPGSGEYSLSRFLTPFAYGQNPTEFRIPHLRIPHVSFLYGENDWMDAKGGLNVQAECEARPEGEAPSVDVFQVSNAGHLLMLDNWRGFNTAMVLSAGMHPDTGDRPLPIKLSPEQNQQRTNEMEKLMRRAPTEPVPA